MIRDASQAPDCNLETTLALPERTVLAAFSASSGSDFPSRQRLDPSRRLISRTSSPFFNEKASQSCAVSSSCFYLCTLHRAKREHPVEQILLPRQVSPDDFYSELLSGVIENRINMNIQCVSTPKITESLNDDFLWLAPVSRWNSHPHCRTGHSSCSTRLLSGHILWARLCPGNT